MGTGNKKEPQALFESISDDGAHWLFVILPENQWEITRDAERVLAGTGENASIKFGVQKFLSFAKERIHPVLAVPA
jgi:hypothetical protein